VPPRLAREAVTAAALRGDSVALLSASAYLPPREAFRYDRRRAAAFSSALAGERQLALSELGLGGGVRSVRLGLDTAVIELLTRGAAPAVEAVRLALRDGVHSEPDVPLLLAACVRRDPELTRSALAVAVSGGTTLERTRAVAAVLGAARPGPLQTAVPAVVAVSLAVAVLAFLRLPGLIDTQEAATPRLQEPRPSVVVASPPEEAAEGAPGAETQRSSTPDAAQIAVRFTPGEAGFGSADGTGSLNGRAGSQPATPRPTPSAPTSQPTAPGPTAPAPPAPSTPAASSPSPAIQSSPASGPASSAPPAAAPPAEDPRQPAVVKKSKAERKAEKAERKAEKAEQKAAKKADKAAAAAPPALSAQPAAAAAPAPEAEAAVALESASASDDASARQAKPDKPEKPDKPDKDK
jgi:hypothetical protein